MFGNSAGTTRLAAPEAKAFSVTVHISDRYLNRMQWYLLTLGFSNPDVRPLMHIPSLCDVFS